MEGQYQIT